MALDSDQLLKAMLEAAKNSLGNNWQLAATTAKDRFQGLAQILVDIETDKLNGDLTESEAQENLEMHQNAVQGALQSLQGIGKLMAQAAINAAMAAVKDIVNKAIGWTLIP
jgi:hypothetical protein